MPRGAGDGGPAPRPRPSIPAWLGLAAALWLPAAGAAQLLEADIRVSVDGPDRVRVGATYRLVATEASGRSAGGEVRLDALRVPGRSLRLTAARVAPVGSREDAGRSGASVGSLELERHPALYRLRGSSGARAARAPLEVRLEYVASGGGDRIPIFVPSTPPPPEGAPIRIRVEGVPDDRSLADAFPRLERAADGSLRARPDNVPSLLILPAASPIPLNRVADVLVIALILAATGYWLRWRRRQDRAEAPGGVADPPAGDVGRPTRKER